MQDKTSDLTPESQIDAEVEAELAKELGELSVDDFMEQAAKPETPAPAPGDEGDDASSQKGAGRANDDRIEMDIHRGRITVVTDNDVFVEVSGVPGKNQGIVPITQFERPPRVGSIMDFVVDRFDPSEGLLMLSREGSARRATWDHLRKGVTVDARVTGSNKGGLELELLGGIRAFMPAGQISFQRIEDLSTMVGEKITAQVQEVDRRGKRVIVSGRRHLEAERERASRRIWAEVEVGQTLEGTIRNIMDFGVFVDLGGVDGFIHISDLSYSRVENPDEMVKIGQEVKVRVLKMDQERERISLGLKQVQPDPWDGVEDRIQAGDQLSGRVTRIADFGAFIEIEPGVEALLPQSEMSWSRHQAPALKENDVINLMVIQVEAKRKRVTLSLKQAKGDPWATATEKYVQHELVEGEVLSITDFGAFVQIESGLEGLVHISELSDKRVNRVEDVLRVGQKEQFRILEIDVDQRRARLSLKAVHEAPPVEEPAKSATRKVRTTPLKGGIDYRW